MTPCSSYMRPRDTHPQPQTQRPEPFHALCAMATHPSAKCHPLLNFAARAVFLLHDDAQTCVWSLAMHDHHSPAWLPRTGGLGGQGQSLLHLCVTSMWDRTQRTVRSEKVSYKGKIVFRSKFHIYPSHQVESRT